MANKDVLQLDPVRRRQTRFATDNGENGGDFPKRQGSGGSSGRWLANLGAIGAIVAAAGALIYGAANLVSSHIRDANATLNDGMDRLHTDISGLRSDLNRTAESLDSRLDQVSGDVMYIKGKLDTEASSEAQDDPKEED